VDSFYLVDNFIQAWYNWPKSKKENMVLGLGERNRERIPYVQCLAPAKYALTKNLQMAFIFLFFLHHKTMHS